MFEDILGKDKRYVKTEMWLLGINTEDYEVEVFNVGKNNDGGLEGYIKDSTYVIDRYTNYTIQMPKTPHHVIRIIVLRVNEHTLKFYVPKIK